MTDLEKIISYFKQISKIPRTSGDEQAISDYLVAFAKERNLEVIQDEYNNVIIKKPAFPGEEHRRPIIFQGHIDMVYVKTEDSDHRYEDGIEVLDNGEFLYAKDTTLGADNGIAVCYALMLLDSKDIKNPPLEFIFTVDEEVGMKGAENLDMSVLEGKALINLDSEEEGIFCVGCAGGVRNTFELPIEREEKHGTYVPVEVSFGKLQGGHSGADIHLERGNAIKLLGRILYALNDFGFEIGAVEAKGKMNVICHSAKMECFVRPEDVERFTECLKACEAVFQNELQFSDEVEVLVEVKPEVDSCTVYTEKTASNVKNALLLLPNGIISWSMGVKGLVQTSTNLGVMEEEDGKLVIGSLVRSSVESQKSIVKSQIEAVADVLGGKSISSRDYPGWEFKKESPLRDLAIEKYEALFGKKAVIEAIHAGLECGFWDGKMENVDIISMGPDMMDVHTVKERVSKQSIDNVWKLLKEIVEAY